MTIYVQNHTNLVLEKVSFRDAYIYVVDSIESVIHLIMKTMLLHFYSSSKKLEPYSGLGELTQEVLYECVCAFTRLGTVTIL